MNYNNLNEGEKRLAVVKFEIEYGDYEHNLLNLAMEKVNPKVVQTEDLMYQVVDVGKVKKAAVEIRKEHAKIRKSLGI